MRGIFRITHTSTPMTGMRVVGGALIVVLIILIDENGSVLL